jgi:drug/metabolite transporter (DMT)-like permease
MNKPLPLLLITGAAFGFNFPLGKLASAAGVNPALWAIVICLGAGLVMMVMSVIFEESVPVPGIARYAAVSGFIANVVPHFLIFAAIPHIGSGLAAIMVALSPVFTALLSILLRVRPPNAWGLAGIGFGLTGAVIIIVARNADFVAEQSLWLFLAAAIPVSLGLGNVHRTMAWPRGAQPMRLASVTNLAAVPPLLLAAYLWGGTGLAALLAVPGLVAAQVVASSIMFTTYFRLQQAGGPTYLSQLGYVAAVLGVGAGIIFLGETYPPLLWAGVAVVAIGITLSTIGQKRSTRG